MKHLKFLIIGIIFGIILSKSEVVSWYRIYEMFKFQSFHMFGIIGTAVISGTVVVQLMKRHKLKGFHKRKIKFKDKKMGWKRYLFGGILFGLGWGMGGRMCVIGVGWGRRAGRWSTMSTPRRTRESYLMHL